MKKAFHSYAIMTAGCVIYGLAFDWFFASNLVAMGGVTGLAQVIHAVAPALSVGVLSFLINVPLFIAGWKFIGFRLLATSLFCMVVCSAAIDGIALFVTFPVMDPMLSALCGGALMGVGIGMVFSLWRPLCLDRWRPHCMAWYPWWSVPG